MRSATGVALTPRMYQSLAAYCRSGSRKEAAAEAGRSMTTLRTHISAAYARLGVGDVLSAARAMGWLVVPGQEAIKPRYGCGPFPSGKP